MKNLYSSASLRAALLSPANSLISSPDMTRSAPALLARKAVSPAANTAILVGLPSPWGSITSASTLFPGMERSMLWRLIARSTLSLNFLAGASVIACLTASSISISILRSLRHHGLLRLLKKENQNSDNNSLFKPSLPVSHRICRWIQPAGLLCWTCPQWSLPGFRQCL